MGSCSICKDEKELEKRGKKELNIEIESIKESEPKKENKPIKENMSEKEIESNKEQINNYIIAEIDIKDNYINKDIRIINSYEEYHRKWDFKQLIANKMNEAVIMECEITINDKLVSFNYFYNFKEKGKYIIKYKFNNDFPRLNYLFYKCDLLTKLDFSNFNTENITTMEAMFSECNSLTDINFSNFNTQNVTNMNHLFYRCKSLIKLDLSCFDTKNVINMFSMFEGCKSLINLNIENFNTEKVDIYEMDYMFEGCESLKIENIITEDEKIKHIFSRENILF